MATFKAAVQKKRADGTYLVYIRVTHNRQVGYIKTEMYVHEGKFRDGEIQDQMIKNRCGATMAGYLKKLSYENISNWSVEEVIGFLPFCFPSHNKNSSILAGVITEKVLPE